MAELYPLETEIATGMQRQLVGLEAQIEALGQRWQDIYAQEQWRWEHVGYEQREMDSWDRGPAIGWAPMAWDREGGAERTQQSFDMALKDMRHAREVREAEPPPLASLEAVTVWRYGQEAVDEARAIAEDPEYQGWQEEQLYEHDPVDVIEIDTSTPVLEEGFQALLARLDARLDAAIQEMPGLTPCMQQESPQEMQY